MKHRVRGCHLVVNEHDGGYARISGTLLCCSSFHVTPGKKGICEVAMQVHSLDEISAHSEKREVCCDQVPRTKRDPRVCGHENLFYRWRINDARNGCLGWQNAWTIISTYRIRTTTFQNHLSPVLWLNGRHQWFSAFLRLVNSMGDKIRVG